MRVPDQAPAGRGADDDIDALAESIEQADEQLGRESLRAPAQQQRDLGLRDPETRRDVDLPQVLPRDERADRPDQFDLGILRQGNTTTRRVTLRPDVSSDTK